MRKYFVISGFAAAVIAASSVGRAGTGEGSTSTGGGTSSSGKVPTFTLDQAILTALQQNPTLLNGEQEIKRTKGVIIQVRAQALPQVTANGRFEWIDPHLTGSVSTRTGVTSTTPTATTGAAESVIQSLPSQVREFQAPLAAPSATPVQNIQTTDVSYSISVLGTQLIFNGTTFSQIRGTFFQRDSAYFAFRNILDQLIATVKTQFYQIVVNRELVKVNEQSVHLLESQLKDQQNRFEAGTVPRFNVLQAEVALYNQLPLLITAQNNLRISKLTLAKTLGLYFQPRRGEDPPLEVLGEMPYIPRPINLADAIEMGKERRPFLKQARANVLNQLQQVRATAGQWLPSITTTGGGEWVSSPVNS
ncbi:MAG TPA: TolC family protein, partial [Candidatus Udaeobacter sp.]|nr:TolC family protein [Candidatus Udaeobacter sp.]